MKLTATQLNFSNLLQLEQIVKDSTPEIKMDNLNAYLHYKKENNALLILVKGRLITATIGISATIISDFISDFTLMINTDNIIHLLSNYTEEQKNKITMMVEISETSTLSFTTDTDIVNFSHLVLKQDEVEGINSLVELVKGDKAKLIFSYDSVSNKEYFLSGLSNCANFIEDDITNNAVAIYKDKMIANDNRHIYNYGLIDNLNLESEPITLHKKVVRNILNLNKKKGMMNFNLHSGGVLFISDTKFEFNAIMNNALSNVSPPSIDDISSIEPTTLALTIPQSSFHEIVKFFIGFYTSKVIYKTIALKTSKLGLEFMLKNTGVVGYNSSHVERKIDIDINPASVDVECMVLITSISDFIANITDNVEVYMDNEHRAVVLSSGRQKIYLPKLKG